MQNKFVGDDSYVPKLLWEQQREKPKAIPSVLTFGDHPFGDDTSGDETCDCKSHELQQF